MTEKPFTVVKREDLMPRCPHCETELPEVYVKTKGVGFVVQSTALFFCPHCHKVLGFGQSRMI